MTLRVTAPEDRADLAAFVSKALRFDDTAVIRLRARDNGRISAWATTQFDVLACRSVRGELSLPDVCAGADLLASGLAAPEPDGRVDIGFPMDSAWRGALPPDSGFVYLDDVPAASMIELAGRGGELAREHGSAHGPPSSLMDQSVVTVQGSDGTRADVPMRCVFAITAMGFIPTRPASDEPVRVRATSAWLRLDARFGSVYRRRTELSLLVR